MDTATRPRASRRTANKVPEITVFFWVIKILCTTVGESFADYIYIPVVYWLAVVLISVVGTLLTDNLTDGQGVPLWVSTVVFAVALAVVFAIWWARERTLSIHTIVTPAREGFYWLTVLVTFALGTAAGDWTLELTGWGPAAAVLLPVALIVAVIAAWRFGAGPVLCFWLAYILTRPLGANIGDYLASGSADGGLGLGTLVTSVVFLAAIGATVAYLTVTKVDRTSTSALDAA